MFRKFAIVVTTILLIIVSGCDKKQASHEIFDENDDTFLIGEEIVLENIISAATSTEILQSTINQMAEGDFEMQRENMLSEDYVIILSGTTVKILEVENTYVKILILAGKYYVDEEYWTFKIYFNHPEYGSLIPGEYL
jgi:hypothetical protein